MGLDMYLYCNSYELVRDIHKDKPYGEYITDLYRKRGVAIYWRKANAIHKWFVDNVQEGKDDCGTYEVEFEQLVELRDICQRIVDGCQLVDGRVHNGDTWANGKFTPNYEDGKVMTNVELAQELLPTHGGFFFGGTDYDQWYYEDVKWTADQLTEIIGTLTKVNENFWDNMVHPDNPEWYVTFRYRSSW